MIDDNLGGSPGISGCQCVTDGPVDQAVCGKPVAGMLVQPGNGLRTFLFPKQVPKKLLEKVVVPEPMPLVIQWDYKEIGLDEPLNDLVQFFL
jgi:hypothetical protein